MSKAQANLFSTLQAEAPSPKERFARLQLIRSHGIGMTGFHRLLAEYGSARDILARLPDDRPGFTPCPSERIHKELKAGKQCKAELILWGDPTYPPALKDIPDPPVALWMKGKTDLLQRPGVALVGARNASSIGLRMAKRLGADLGGEGMVVISGLARGTDAAAHEGALSHGTIAVVAGGVDVIYPPDNKDLQSAISATGLLISEHPPGTHPTARHFPMRNRIISGLSQGVVVIEAALKSGSMITAKNALDQGREVMAVPGHPIDTRAGGCNALIRDGATLIRGADDVLLALPPITSTSATPTKETQPQPRSRPPRKPPADITALHREILDRMSSAPQHESDLMDELNVTLPDLDLLLTRLELDGQLERKSGGILRLLR
ncbi:DNA-processing protein DprA [Halocynthiibacter sp.]|uniref:DNA-processing protein DprA n=1 Tax=Halocynthiibacter sp. TaxID=1979210 RepID=UPI003C3D85DC